MKLKIYSAVITLILLALIDSNLNPSLWQVGLSTIIIYETAKHIIKTIFRQTHVVDGRYRKVKSWWEEIA